MSQQGTDENEEVTLVMVLAGSAGVLITAAGTLALTAWSNAVAWMLEHKVLVPAANEPLLTFPHSDGAGLDYSRCFVIAAAVLLIGFGGVQAVRRRWRRNREQM